MFLDTSVEMSDQKTMSWRCENVIFWRKCGKYDFLYLSGQWPEWRYMVGNRSLTCSKAILHRNLIYNHVFKALSENRKKSILKKNFRTMHQQNWPKIHFPAEYRPNFILRRKNTSMPLTKKFLRSSLELVPISPQNLWRWPVLAKKQHFTQVLFLLLLLLFWVPRCCFSKSMKLGLSEKYMVYGVISGR